MANLALDASQPTVILVGTVQGQVGPAYALPQRPAGGVANYYAFSTSTTGSPSGCAVAFQGSLDGIIFTTVVNLSNATGIFETLQGVTGTFIRASVTTLTGGTNPTVTCTVQPGE